MSDLNVDQKEIVHDPEESELKKIIYSKDFFDLQVQFAKKASDIMGVSEGEALLAGSSVYRELKFGDTIDPGDPEWQKFVAGYMVAGDKAEYVHKAYMERVNSNTDEEPENVHGCFSYDYDSAKHEVRIHFADRERSADQSPLSKGSLLKRSAELERLFDDVHQNHPDAQIVRGSSWLYNVDNYRTLFPEDYIASAQEAGNRYQRVDLWGQFLKRDGTVRADAKHSFMQNLSTAKNSEDLRNVFPKQVLSVQGPISSFYQRFHVK